MSDIASPGRLRVDTDILQQVLTCRLGGESARFRDQGRDEERAEDQRRHHEYVSLSNLPSKKEEYTGVKPGRSGKSKSSKYRNEMHAIHLIPRASLGEPTASALMAITNCAVTRQCGWHVGGTRSRWHCS
jgi:hypothetical protein